MRETKKVLMWGLCAFFWAGTMSGAEERELSQPDMTQGADQPSSEDLIQGRGVPKTQSFAAFWQERERLAPPAAKQKLQALRNTIKAKNLKIEVGYTSVFDLLLEEITGFIPPTPKEYQEAITQQRAMTGQQAEGERQYKESIRGKSVLKAGGITTRGACDSQPYFSWRDTGAVTSIRDQGGCGSCVPFASIAALESGYLIRNAVTTDQSEQYVLDASSASCQGTMPSQVMKFLTHWGTVNEENRPYAGVDRGGLPNPEVMKIPHPFQGESFGYIECDGGGEISTYYCDRQTAIPILKQALCEHGPITVTLTATPLFQAWAPSNSHQVYPAESDTGRINHNVLLVGWDDARQAWLIKNSWGTNWGSAGWTWIRYGSNHIGKYAAYIHAKSYRGWHDWSRIGGTTMKVGAPVSALRTSNGQTGLAVVGQDQRVYYTWGNNPQAWTPWIKIHDMVAAPGTRVTMIEPRPGHVDLFVSGIDGGVFTTYWEAVGDWRPWIRIGNVSMRPGSAITALTTSNGYPNLFIVGQDGGVYHAWGQNPSNWRPWHRLSNFEAYVGSQVAATEPRPGHVELFVSSPGGEVFNTWWEAVGDWRPWKNIAGLTMQPESMVTAVATTGPNAVTKLFAVGRDGGVYWSGGISSTWQPWRRIHTLQVQIGSQVGALESSPGRVDVFVSDGIGRVMSTFNTVSAFEWEPWFKIHEMRIPVGSPITTSLLRSNTIHVDLFAGGTDGGVYATWWGVSQ